MKTGEALRKTLTATAALVGVLGGIGMTNSAAPVRAQAPAGPGQQPASPGQNPSSPGQTTPAQTTPASGRPLGGGTGTGNGVTTTGPNPQGGNGGNVRRPGSENESPLFDLGRTVRAALESSSDLQIARRNVEIDEKRADEVAAQGRLGVTGRASATRYDQATKISIGGAPAIEVLKEHSENLELDVTQRIDLFGQIRAETSQLRLQSLADRFTLDSITNGRILQAQSIYFNLLRAEHQLQVSQSALRAVQAQQDIARKLYEGQVGQKIDLLRANTQVAQAQQEVEAATNNRDIARANFNNLVGRPLNAPAQLTDVPGVTIGVDVAPATASAAVGTTPSATATTGFTPFVVPPSETSINMDQSIATALNARPEILQSAVLVRAAETGIRVARGGLQPQFAVTASGNYYPTTSFQTPRQRVAAITASVQFPLWDGGATRDRIAEARLRRENAQITLESTQSDVTLSVREAYLNLQTAARQTEAANVALEQAVAARQLAQVRYEGQVGLYLEVTDAQAALTRAENAQVDAVYNYLIARAQFQNAVGTPQQGLSLPASAATPVTVAPGVPVVPATTTPAAPGTTIPVTPPATPSPTTPQQK